MAAQTDQEPLHKFAYRWVARLLFSCEQPASYPFADILPSFYAFIKVFLCLFIHALFLFLFFFLLSFSLSTWSIRIGIACTSVSTLPSRIGLGFFFCCIVREHGRRGFSFLHLPTRRRMTVLIGGRRKKKDAYFFPLLQA
jgi:hypothetical protein